jgi:hypothetical protein
MNRKAMADAYDQRVVVGGVYQVRNLRTGRVLLASANDLAAARNRFAFAVSTNSCVYHDLAADWRAFGADAFVFEELEGLARGVDQSPAAFAADIKELEALWREKLAQTAGVVST